MGKPAVTPQAWGSISYWLAALRVARHRHVADVGSGRALLLILIPGHAMPKAVARAFRGLRHVVADLPAPDLTETIQHWAERAGIPMGTLVRVRTASFLATLRHSIHNDEGRLHLTGKALTESEKSAMLLAVRDVPDLHEALGSHFLAEDIATIRAEEELKHAERDLTRYRQVFDILRSELDNSPSARALPIDVLASWQGLLDLVTGNEPERRVFRAWSRTKSEISMILDALPQIDGASWAHEPEQIALRWRSGRLVASIYVGGTWHTWDANGVGGENGSRVPIDVAAHQALEALARQGWDRPVGPRLEFELAEGMQVSGAQHGQDPVTICVANPRGDHDRDGEPASIEITGSPELIDELGLEITRILCALGHASESSSKHQKAEAIVARSAVFDTFYHLETLLRTDPSLLDRLPDRLLAWNDAQQLPWEIEAECGEAWTYPDETTGFCFKPIGHSDDEHEAVSAVWPRSDDDNCEPARKKADPT